MHHKYGGGVWGNFIKILNIQICFKNIYYDELTKNTIQNILPKWIFVAYISIVKTTIHNCCGCVIQFFINDTVSANYIYPNLFGWIYRGQNKRHSLALKFLGNLQ